MNLPAISPRVSRWKNRFKMFVGDWWKWHEGWVAVGFVAISCFSFGYVCASAAGAIDHRNDVRNLSDAYRSALESKDQVIAQLARSAADTSKAAVTAAVTAGTAADTAATAADTAATAADTAAKAAKQSEKAASNSRELRKLK